MTKLIAAIGLSSIVTLIGGAGYYFVRTPNPREYSRNPEEWNDKYGPTNLGPHDP